MSESYEDVRHDGLCGVEIEATVGDFTGRCNRDFGHDTTAYPHGIYGHRTLVQDHGPLVDRSVLLHWSALLHLNAQGEEHGWHKRVEQVEREIDELLNAHEDAR